MITNLKTIQSSPSKGRVSGFGLVELLTVIAVLGIMTSILVPAMAGVSESANTKRCQRIAQEFAALYMSSIAAGCTDLDNPASVSEVLEKLIAGVKGSGVFADTQFRLPNVALADQNESAHHLSIEGGLLIYSPQEP
jgi:prepilin-type N-terminal cleavage/methylation domain-containing protein